MAATRLADVIVPDVWLPYVIERTAELSALWQSGIVQPVQELAAFVAEGGNLLNMPFWQDLQGEDEVLSATGDALTVNAITAEQDAAVVLARGKAWGVNELAAQLSGDDPLRAIGDLVAEYWARRQQAAALAVIEGAFAAANMDTNRETSGAPIDAATTLDAIQKLGDAKSRLAAFAMHSQTENALAKQDLIEYERPSDGAPRIPFYLGKPVVVDDGLVVNEGTPDTYVTYIFGQGALGYAEGTGGSKVTAVETDRDSLAGEDILINRRHFVLHPRGVRYIGAATGGGPTNATLETGTNWNRVYEPKNVRMVRFEHQL